MYKLSFNDYTLHDLRSEEFRVRDPDVHLAVDEAGELSFTIDQNHPHANKLTRTKGVVTLSAGNARLFRGRIRKDTKDFYLSRRIEVEGLLACLNDSLIPPHSFPDDFLDDEAYQEAAANGNVVEFYLGWLLDQHNSQVGQDQQVKLGDVTVSDPNNYISRSSSEYLTTMEVVRKKLKDLIGGYLLADYSTDDTVLHYYSDLPLTNVQEVEFAKNLLDLEVELDSADTYTAILPVGKDGITIFALPDGEVSPGFIKTGMIVYSIEAEEAAGGRITRKVDWQDVTDAQNLRRKAIEQLATDGVKHVQTITCKAVDLGGISASGASDGTTAVVGRAVVGRAVVGRTDSSQNALPVFRVGRYVRLKSPPHGFAAAYPLMELEPNILNPGDTTITLGASVKAASDIAHSNQSAIEEKQGQQQINLNQQKESIESLVETVHNQATEIIQNSQQIMLAALESYAKTSDLDSFRETMESQFSVMSSEISMKFTQVSEQMVNIDGDLQKTLETLAMHFEFGLDGLTIKAGENAQSMSLRLVNNLITFNKDGQQFGWWDGVDFHTGNIIIDVNERAQLGNFAAIPRSTGNLSWMKVRN